MEAYEENQGVFDIRQYASAKRYTPSSRDVEGEKYLEHVETLLEEIDSLLDMLSGMDDRYEYGYDSGYKEGYDNGRQDGEAEGISISRRTVEKMLEHVMDAINRLSE